MELAEIVNEIIRRGMTQERLAAVLKTRQGKISEMASTTPKSTWEKHWQIFLRLIGVCHDLDIDPAQDLKVTRLARELGHAAIDKTAGEPHAGGTGEGKSRTPRSISTRRVTGTSGKRR